MKTKKIPGFSRYEISTDGVLINDKGWTLKPYNASGYLNIKLTNDKGRKTTVSVHRLVAMTFIGKIRKGLWVNHRNGEKHDNRVENLEIGTPAANHRHAVTVLKRRFAQGEDCGASRLTDEAVEAIRLLHSAGWSQRKISLAFMTSQVNVHLIVTGKTRRAPSA